MRPITMQIKMSTRYTYTHVGWVRLPVAQAAYPPVGRLSGKVRAVIFADEIVRVRLNCSCNNEKYIISYYTYYM